MKKKQKQKQTSRTPYRCMPCRGSGAYTRSNIDLVNNYKKPENPQKTKKNPKKQKTKKTTLILSTKNTKQNKTNKENKP